VHWGITPPFIEESACTVEMLKILLIGRTSPEFHIANFKVRPEVTCGISIRLLVMFWSPIAILKPFHRVIWVKIVIVVRDKFHRLRPKASHTLWTIVEVDREAVGLVMVLHVCEDIVVDVTEKVDVGFNTPVVTCVKQRWVLVEEAAVPPTHLMVGLLLHILNILFLEYLHGLLEQVFIYPGRNIPMRFWNHLCRNLVICTRLNFV